MAHQSHKGPHAWFTPRTQRDMSAASYPILALQKLTNSWEVKANASSKENGRLRGGGKSKGLRKKDWHGLPKSGATSSCPWL